MASSDNSKTLSPFDLPTHQRRLRHFKSLAVRNLVCKGYMGREVVKLQTYFTLHKDAQSKAFYTSEKITGSLNPSWQSFDLSRLNEEVDMAAKFVVVRVWGGHDKKTRLLVEWQVHFSGLVFLTEKLQKDGMKFATNSLVFGLFEKYFSIPAEESKQEAVCDPSSSLRLSTLTVEQVTVHNSYTVSSLSRIHTILRAIQQTQVTVHRVHHSIEDRLLASQEKAAKLSEREALLLKVNQLRGELRWQTSQSQAERDKRDRQKAALKQRGALLKENYSTMGSKYDSLQAQRQQHIATRENLVKTNAQLNMRRRQLIEELATHIYPITQLPNSKGHAICGVILPNAEEFQGHDDYSIAVALGYTCHMVLMMSQFLDTPLWYPMVHRGSKSVIRDHIISKLSERDRDFVLYGKNKDKIQFHYGVYLLNKNISQLRYQYGLATQDLRLTLQNLLSLLELRLGLKFDSSRVPFPVALNSSSRQLSVDTAYSQQRKEGVANDHHGNDLTDGPTHSNQEQMIEQLIQESRAMTGETSNTNWAENLNSKPTWSLQNNSDSSFNDVDSNKDSTDIFKPSPGGIFHEEKSEYKQNGKHQNYVDDSAVSKHNGLDGDNITGEDILSSKVVSQGSQNIKDDLKENVVPKSGSFTDITRTDEVLKTSSENIAVESVSTGQPSEGIGDTVSQKQSSPERVSGTFKTSAFKKVPRIDSSEEVTEDARFSTSSDNIPSLPKYQASYDHDIH